MMMTSLQFIWGEDRILKMAAINNEVCVCVYCVCVVVIMRNTILSLFLQPAGVQPTWILQSKSLNVWSLEMKASDWSMKQPQLLLERRRRWRRSSSLDVWKVLQVSQNDEGSSILVLQRIKVFVLLCPPPPLHPPPLPPSLGEEVCSRCKETSCPWTRGD